MKTFLDITLITVCVILLARWIYEGVRLYLVYRQDKQTPKLQTASSRFHQKERKVVWLAPTTKMLSNTMPHSHRVGHLADNHTHELQIKHQNREHADLVKK